VREKGKQISVELLIPSLGQAFRCEYVCKIPRVARSELCDGGWGVHLCSGFLMIRISDSGLIPHDASGGRVRDGGLAVGTKLWAVPLL
jgi:hypothetical protein